MNSIKPRGKVPQTNSVFKVLNNVLLSIIYKTKRWFRNKGKQSITLLIRREQLHKAVKTMRPDIVLKLLQKGRNVNALDEHHRTPLFYALTLDSNSTEIVSMLLCYGAEVLFTDKENVTPISYALKQHYGIIVESIDNLPDTVTVLYDYYDAEYYKRSIAYRTAQRSSYGKDMVKFDSWVNLSTEDFGKNFCLQTLALRYSLNYDTSELFKLLWHNMDYNALILRRPGFMEPPRLGIEIHYYRDFTSVPILIYYLRATVFEGPEWIECLYLLLHSPVAKQLVEDCLNYKNSCHRPNEFYFIQELVEAFENKNIKLDDRVCIIYTCLSLGVVANYSEVDSVFQIYGFGEELELLLHNIESYKDIMKSEWKFSLLPMYILGCETTNCPEFLYQVYKREIELRSFKQDTSDYLPSYFTKTTSEKLRNSTCLLNSLGYFSLPENYSYKLRECAKRDLKNYEEICLKLDKIPTMPSLLELSRNMFRLHLKNIHQFQNPYEFHDCIKKLKIPDEIKDIIRFKQCIYN